MDSIEQLRLQLTSWGVEPAESQLLALKTYADILVSYTSANVIGTRDREEIVLGHLGDALSCLLVEDLHRPATMVDVGTGGGLPGIPLGIMLTEVYVTLLEAANKKASFLEYARRRLGLQNLEILRARAEETGRDHAYREKFDIATARALAALPVVVEYCAPLLRIGGTLVAMKARLTEEELLQGKAASQKVGLNLREVRKVGFRAQLPQKERHLVLLDKVDATPSKFPRRVGQAKKRPLAS